MSRPPIVYALLIVLLLEATAVLLALSVAAVAHLLRII